MVFYSTTFPSAPETPVSEGGAWHHTANGWANIDTAAAGTPATTPARSYSGQSGADPPPFNDAYAYLSGFSANVASHGVIYKDPTITTDPDGAHEIELLFRMTDTSTTAAAYECNMSFDGVYAELGVWNGALNSFGVLGGQAGGPFAFPINTMPPVTGDIHSGYCFGTAPARVAHYIDKHDGKGPHLLGGGTDSTYTTGSPAMGGWISKGVGTYDPKKFGYSSFYATDITALNYQVAFSVNWGTGPGSLNDDGGGDNGQSLRQLIPVNMITAATAGQWCRISVANGNASVTNAANQLSTKMFFGQQGATAPNFNGNQRQVFFNGSASVGNGAASAMYDSDWFQLGEPFDPTKPYILAFDCPAAATTLTLCQQTVGVTAACTFYFTATAAGTDASQTTPSGTPGTVTTYVGGLVVVEIAQNPLGGVAVNDIVNNNQQSLDMAANW